MADSHTHNGSGGGPASNHTASASASAAFPAPSTARRLLRLLGGTLPTTSGNNSTNADNNAAASQLSQPATMAGNGSSGGNGQSQPLTEQEGADLLAYLHHYGRALHAAYNGRRRRGAANGGNDNDDGDVNGDNNNNNTADDGTSNNRDDGLFSALVVTTLRAAHRSTADHFSSSSAVGIASGAGGGARPTSSSSSNGNINAGAGASAGGGMMEIDTPLAVANLMAAGGPPPLTPRLARRLLTDGLLPLASVGGRSVRNGNGGGSGGNDDEEVDKQQQGDNDDVIGELVRRCVVECILPCAVVMARGDANNTTNSNNSNNIVATAMGTTGSTMDNLNSDIGLDVLLPAYLNRLVTARHPQAPAILDAFCAMERSGCALRPHRAAAVAAALGELCELCPAALTGCVSVPVLQDGDGEEEEKDGNDATGKPKKAKKAKKDLGKKEKGGGGTKKQSTNKDIDRITSLTDALLRSLQTLTTVHTQELDCLPPLVYQLCLLPSKIERGSRAAVAGAHGSALVVGGGGAQSSFMTASSLLKASKAAAGSSSGGGGGGGASSAMAVVSVSDVITVELRIRILAGIADVFDGLREKVDVAARAAAEALAGADSAATTGQQRRALGIDADAVRWAVGTSLSHVGMYCMSQCNSCFDRRRIITLYCGYTLDTLTYQTFHLLASIHQSICQQALASEEIQTWSRPFCVSSRATSRLLPTAKTVHLRPSATFGSPPSASVLV